MGLLTYLECKSESGGTIALNPYDNFLRNTPPNSNNFTGGNQPYYTGGSLGFVDFIGKFESTADLSIYQPLVQRIELFVPAIPVIEVVGQSNVIPATSSTPPIYVFCELVAIFYSMLIQLLHLANQRLINTLYDADLTKLHLSSWFYGQCKQ